MRTLIGYVRLVASWLSGKGVEKHKTKAEPSCAVCDRCEQKYVGASSFMSMANPYVGDYKGASMANTAWKPDPRGGVANPTPKRGD